MNYSIVNLKTDPKLKKQAMLVANGLGVSLSAILNNELRRFTTEKSVIFEHPEYPNIETAKKLATSKKAIKKGDYYSFQDNEKAIEFLKSSMDI